MVAFENVKSARESSPALSLFTRCRPERRHRSGGIRAAKCLSTPDFHRTGVVSMRRLAMFVGDGRCHLRST